MNALYKGTVADLLREALSTRLTAARNQWDRLFGMLAPSALYERPIPERHRIAFYLGHLEAFDRNMICGESHSELDRMFAFGIDPVDGKLPDDKPDDWPSIEDIRSYNRRARSLVDKLLTEAAEPLMIHVAIEHRLMHCETFAYMLHWLSHEMKRPESLPLPDDRKSPEFRMVDVPAGIATLGQKSSDPLFQFGWDNEFESQTVFVPEFGIGAFNVTNGQFLEFCQAGGYSERSFWDDDAWKWIQGSGVQHPKFWVRRGQHWFYRTIFDEIPMPLAWPVYVSHAEASAYSRWKGKSLPTEAQYHRAAYGSRTDCERLYPWGDIEPRPQHGNFDSRSWTPAPVGSFPDGQSDFGIFDLAGNGWEWMSTTFSPFPGFKPFPFYPGYSADFFDGKHFVMKGGSPRTAAAFLRRSFRNWFQPYYPNIYAAFRCVEQ
jgi:gamma-glutamyl hercynylcysteine S-oxide synthase